MRDFKQIIELIKTHLTQQRGGMRIFDREVADALGISQTNFGAMKVRGKIPYEELMHYAKEEKLSLDELFYSDASPKEHNTKAVFSMQSTLSLIQMPDDTMEPLIAKGEDIYYNEEDKEIDAASIYVINMHRTLYVRHIQPLLNGTIELIPANKTYITENTLASHIEILGKVKKILKVIL